MTLPLSRGTSARAEFRRLAESEAPLLLLDLDGTLAPLRGNPRSRARVPAETRRTIQALRLTNACVVLVSGRSIAAVRRVAGTPVDAIIGDHGARALIGGRITSWIAADRKRLTAAVHAIEPLVDATPGIVLERKDRSLAIHLRVPGQHAHPRVRAIAHWLRGAGLRVLLGHRVRDAQLPGVNKGVAVTRWLERHVQDAVLYAGDDTTDADAFRARDPHAFATWLARLAHARAPKRAAP